MKLFVLKRKNDGELATRIRWIDSLTRLVADVEEEGTPELVMEETPEIEGFDKVPAILHVQSEEEQAALDWIRS